MFLFKKIEILFSFVSKSIIYYSVMTHTSLQNKLPKDVWRVISEFNEFLFIGNKIIDVSNIHPTILKHRVVDGVIVLDTSEFIRWTLTRSMDGTIMQTRSVSCGGLCNPPPNKYTINHRNKDGIIDLSFDYYIPLCNTCSCRTHYFSN
jgi:hypothetical protein